MARFFAYKFCIPISAEAFFIPIEIEDGINVTSSVTSSVDYRVMLNVTSMRVDPVYSSWANWSQVKQEL
jgi:hypothetical protein